MGGRYLGAWLVAVARGARIMARRWEASQLEFVRQELWRRTIERLAARVEQLLARPVFPATRAA
eukprot:6720288-Lingulodinium_polyedra.AAC.1